eukprot:CAMPEP_0175920486 /NCGR_PEP_ID=MMETSP0108-20121206/12952_1 /TAXON_ID=195067 ORGANISM="Goniomonas pacifica, Strain CCMP1869" /NCGR_SAMPLE_ID=MMETSP0108 /ASSEMBLY_ACC=CAM_ASM_000204 /LENGTH=44 /DNA_ID= /DNA_START= /DNA_END= /DNA_ORIENTATION=
MVVSMPPKFELAASRSSMSSTVSLNCTCATQETTENFSTVLRRL